MPSMERRSTLPGIVALLLARAVLPACCTHGTVVPGDPLSLLSEPVYGLLRNVVQQLAENSTSPECRNDIRTLLYEASLGEKWALKMFDAMGKPGSGVLEGGVSYPGYFSECVKTRMDDHTTGRYCLAHLELHEDTESNETVTSLYPKLEVGVCVPSSCQQKDVEFAVEEAAQSFHEGVTTSLRECYARDENMTLDWATWLVICLFSTFLLLAFVGTFLDISSRSSSGHKSNRNREGHIGIPTMERYGIPSVENHGATASNCSSETLCKEKTQKEIINLSSVLRAFSLLSNGRKILSTERAEGTLTALHGIRFLSMVWIMTGHSVFFAGRWLFFRNPKVMSSAPKDFLSQAFANGTFAVDTFFFLGGFLASYTLLRQMKRTNGKFSILALYMHRYLRMTPVMMIVIAFSSTILKYVGSGPTWKVATQMYDDWCRQNWWINAIYVQNFVQTDYMCLSHTWYSAVDMQFYIIAPIIIKLCFWHTYGAVAGLLIPFIVTSACPMLYTFIYHLPAVPSDTVPITLMNEYFQDVYIKPYCRMGPYLVGIALGYFIYRKNFSVRITTKNLAIGWTLAIIVNVGIIYSIRRVFNSNPLTDIESALYNGFSRTAWAATIAWMAVTCYAGQAEFLNRILSLPVITPLSRLTYSAYLIHPVLMAVFYGSRETVFDFSIYWLVYTALGNLVITYTVSFVLSILFESPIISIEKLYRSR